MPQEALLAADLGAGEMRAGRERAEGRLRDTRAELAGVALDVEENRWVCPLACAVGRGGRAAETHRVG